MEKTRKTIVLMAIIQSQDVENAENCLQEIGVGVNHLPSVGGFLGRKNATLLIPITEDEMESTLAVIQENCRQRIEYIAVPLESAPLPLPTPTPVTVGGATIFNLEIEHYEEI